MHRFVLGLMTCISLAMAVPGQAASQDVVALDPSIVTVITDGGWTQGDTRGIYRVIVRTGGSEHLVSAVQIDWLTEPRPDSSSVVRRSVLVDAVNDASDLLIAPVFRQVSIGWEVTLLGINTHLEPMTKTCWVIVLGRPGELKVSNRIP